MKSFKGLRKEIPSVPFGFIFSFFGSWVVASFGATLEWMIFLLATLSAHLLHLISKRSSFSRMCILKWPTWQRPHLTSSKRASSFDIWNVMIVSSGRSESRGFQSFEKRVYDSRLFSSRQKLFFLFSATCGFYIERSFDDEKSREFIPFRSWKTYWVAFLSSKTAENTPFLRFFPSILK